MMTATQPRVWIGCLACYNAGRLVGDWFDATDAGDVDYRDVHAQERARLHVEGKPSGWGVFAGHEELRVMDHEGFDGLLKGECSPAEAQALADALENVPAGERAAFGAYVASGYEPDAVTFAEAYCGEWDSMEAYADELLEETGMYDQLPEWAQAYFDTEKWARDLELSGDYWTAGAHPGVYVFRSV